jgi:hypothetical protein
MISGSNAALKLTEILSKSFPTEVPELNEASMWPIIDL